MVRMEAGWRLGQSLPIPLNAKGREASSVVARLVGWYLWLGVGASNVEDEPARAVFSLESHLLGSQNRP